MNSEDKSKAAVLKPSSDEYCRGLEVVRGCTFENFSYEKLWSSFQTSGLQATNLATAMRITNQMLDFRSKSGCTIFLSYTSNMISSGIRENIKFLVKNKLVDCLITTGGGIEEDFIKCLKTEDGTNANTFIGDFELSGKSLRENGINRIGNMLVPNDNYCLFENWTMPIFDKMLAEQKASEGKLLWPPSRIIERLGDEINHEDSIYYWAAKNGIPVFSPSFLDGSLGDMMDFHSFRSEDLIDVNILSDMRRLNSLTRNTFESKTGVIILGGGAAKHHTMNANLMRNGADFAVYINTASEFDGSDSGARPDEAVSWGKIKTDAKSVKVHCDASIAFPLLVAETFYKHLKKTS